MPLGQGHLIDPPPTRRLIVPAGAVNFYGVDPSTLRVAIATVTPDGRRGSSIASFPRLTGAARLPAIRSATLQLAEDLVDVLPPGVIVLEKPAGFGDRPNPELAYAVGAIMCALAEAAPGIAVELVEGSKWKREVCGFGGIKKTRKVNGKPRPLPTDDYEVLRWARAHGYTGSSWDEADAWAIARFAELTYALDQR